MSLTRVLMLSSVLALTLLAACSKAPPALATPAKDAAPAPATGSAIQDAGASAASAAPESSALAALDLGEFKIVSVTLGSQLDAEKNVTVAKTRFSPKDSIHAAVVSVGKHQGLKMTAKWSTAGGTTIAETEQVLVPESAAVSTFSIANAEPWPVGMYRVSIALEGREQQSIAFEIR